MAIDIDFLRQLDRFRLMLKQKVLSRFQGEHSSALPGEGLVFKDYSTYSRGDDIRNIDWNVYARTEKLFIKRYEEERNMIMHIILDASASMNFGRQVKKFEYAAMLGLGFAYMSMRDNGKFNFATFSDKLEILQTNGGRNIISIVDHLNKLNIGGKTNLIVSMEKYKTNILSKSIIVIVSDFLYDPADIKEIIMRYRKNYLFLIQVLDPVEKELDLQGDLILRDMETKDTLRTFISQRFRNQYKRRLADHCLELKDICDHFKASFVSTTTDTPVFDTFYNILFQK